MSKKEKKNKIYDFPISRSASFNECTGLIPTPVTDEEEADSYEDIYDVFQPDGEDEFWD